MNTFTKVNEYPIVDNIEYSREDIKNNSIKNKGYSGAIVVPNLNYSLIGDKSLIQDFNLSVFVKEQEPPKIVVFNNGKIFIETSVLDEIKAFDLSKPDLIENINFENLGRDFVTIFCTDSKYRYFAEVSKKHTSINYLAMRVSLHSESTNVIKEHGHNEIDFKSLNTIRYEDQNILKQIFGDSYQQLRNVLIK